MEIIEYEKFVEICNFAGVYVRLRCSSEKMYLVVNILRVYDFFPSENVRHPKHLVFISNRIKTSIYY